MAEQSPLFPHVRTILAKRGDRREEDITEDTKLADFGFDSLDTVELGMELEEKLGVKDLELKDAEQLTVRDLCAILAEKGAASS